MLKDQISDAIKTAMKARELEKVKVLRNVQAVIKQIEIDRQIALDDHGVLEVLQKQTKQRQESLAIFQDNGREDLAQKEKFEIDVISEFLPQALSEDELSVLVDAEIAQQGATSMQQMGSVMNALKAQTTGRADPALLSKLVKARLG
ncbi:GatB/YqeY domain-containing protein [Moraxella atlantae]|mgnify:FL=1|uniref:Glutamyl-tRNA amidotransferase n=1 Tax=Faucicola atlantae TaxID=34059 RepID=A0A1B8QGY5_9GAMM|nr:glutamyl-tRNA amidotransferase [Moraxella atlantae]